MSFAFFCEKDVIGSDRHAMTKKIHERLTDCATLLEDNKVNCQIELLKKQNITLTAFLQFTKESMLYSENKERISKMNRNDMQTVKHLQSL